MDERRRVFIHAAACVPSSASVPLTQDPVNDLGPLAKQVLGQRLRQASHFIELATIGARLCLNQAGATAPDMAVYVGTALGEVRKTDALFHQVFPPGAGMAAPFDFINATANMAAFYVARLAGTSARNLTVTQGRWSFEAALQLALADLRAGAVASALVGGVDENCFPRASYLRRWPLRDDEIMGEGSAWLYLSTVAQGALAELLSVQRLDALDARVTGIDHVVCGAQLDATDRRALAQFNAGARLHDYIAYCGNYPTAAGFGIARQFEPQPSGGRWAHVNRDADGSVLQVVWQVG
jgi:hypothetical protein